MHSIAKVNIDVNYCEFGLNVHEFSAEYALLELNDVQRSHISKYPSNYTHNCMQKTKAWKRD